MNSSVTIKPLSLGDVTETMVGWDLAEAEAFSKALWLEGAAGVMKAMPGRPFTKAQVASLVQQMNDLKAAALPCKQTGQELEATIDWRHGDHFIMDLIRKRHPFSARLNLLALRRCSYTEADLLVLFFTTRLNLGNVTFVPTDLDGMKAQPEARYLLRWRDIIWSWHNDQPERGFPKQFIAGGSPCCWVNHEDLDQIWRVDSLP